MDGLSLPSKPRIDHLALFKEINEFVSFHELLEPLSPYSSDSEESCSLDSLPRSFSVRKLRFKRRLRKGPYGEMRDDPSADRLFQFLARSQRRKSQIARNGEQSNQQSTTCDPESLVNLNSIQWNPKKGGKMRQRKDDQEENKQEPVQVHSQNPLQDQEPLQLDQQKKTKRHAANRKLTLAQFKSLSISDTRSNFKSVDKGLSKYPNYIDYVNNIKKPLELYDRRHSESSGSVPVSGDGNGDFNPRPPSPELDPAILSVLQSIIGM